MCRRKCLPCMHPLVFVRYAMQSLSLSLSLTLPLPLLPIISQAHANASPAAAPSSSSSAPTAVHFRELSDEHFDSVCKNVLLSSSSLADEDVCDDALAKLALSPLKKLCSDNFDYRSSSSSKSTMLNRLKFHLFVSEDEKAAWLLNAWNSEYC